MKSYVKIIKILLLLFFLTIIIFYYYSSKLIFSTGNFAEESLIHHFSFYDLNKNDFIIYLSFDDLKKIISFPLGNDVVYRPRWIGNILTYSIPKIDAIIYSFFEFGTIKFSRIFFIIISFIFFYYKLNFVTKNIADKLIFFIVLSLSFEYYWMNGNFHRINKYFLIFPVVSYLFNFIYLEKPPYFKIKSKIVFFISTFFICSIDEIGIFFLISHFILIVLKNKFKFNFLFENNDFKIYLKYLLYNAIILGFIFYIFFPIDYINLSLNNFLNYRSPFTMFESFKSHFFIIFVDNFLSLSNNIFHLYLIKNHFIVYLINIAIFISIAIYYKKTQNIFDKNLIELILLQAIILTFALNTIFGYPQIINYYYFINEFLFLILIFSMFKNLLKNNYFLALIFIFYSFIFYTFNIDDGTLRTYNIFLNKKNSSISKNLIIKDLDTIDNLKNYKNSKLTYNIKSNKIFFQKEWLKYDSYIKYYKSEIKTHPLEFYYAFYINKKKKEIYKND